MKKSYSIQKTLFSLMLAGATTAFAQTDDVNFNMNVNDGMGGTGVNVNINVTGTGTQTQSSTTTTTTTTTTSGTSTTGASSSNTSTNDNATTTAASNSSSCSMPIGAADFKSAKSSIEAKPFSDTKMTLAKQIIKNNCFNVAQVKELMMLFTYEEEKVDIAKMCYLKTIDYNNYYQVNDVFTFAGSTDELTTYIDSVKR
ncbi:MAG: DUF4476 domain-containing protein [Flavobacteriales bacterium]